MQINWKEEIQKRREALLTDLQALLKIESVRDETQATGAAPLLDQDRAQHWRNF